MTQHLNDQGLLFTRSEQPGFELPDSPGVVVRPVFVKHDGRAVDTFFLTIPEGREVTPESHPFSETLVVLEGRIACSIEDGDPVEVGPGQVWHNEADHRHHVRNVGTGAAELAMLIGA